MVVRHPRLALCRERRLQRPLRRMVVRHLLVALCRMLAFSCRSASGKQGPFALCIYVSSAGKGRRLSSLLQLGLVALSVHR